MKLVPCLHKAQFGEEAIRRENRRLQLEREPRARRRRHGSGEGYGPSNT